MLRRLTKAWVLQALLTIAVIIGIISLIQRFHSITPAEPLEPGEVQRERAMTQLRSLMEKTDGRPGEGDLIELERANPKTKAAALARFLRAYQKYNAGDLANSAPLFEESVIKEGTELGDYALYYQGRAYQESSSYAEAIKAFDRLAEKYPQSLFARESQLTAGDLALQSGDAHEATKILKSLVEKKDATALWITAQAKERSDHNNDAIDLYKTIYYEQPQSSESEKAYDRLIALGVAVPEPGKDGYKLMQTRADRLYETGQFGRAVDVYSKLNAQYGEYSATARNGLRYGISLYNMQRYRDAAIQLQGIAGKEKELTAEAKYFLAKSYLKQKLMGQFADAAQQALAAKQTAERSADLLGPLVGYFKSANPTQANRYKEQLIQDYPNSKEADQASYQEAWAVHTDRRFAEASDALIEHLAAIPNSDTRGNSAYWAARDAERSGNNARALALYEAFLRRYSSGYYGYLAEKHVAELKNRGIKPEKPAEHSRFAKVLNSFDPPVPIPETATESADPRLQRASNLQSIRLYDLAMVELEAARKEAPNSQKISLAIATIYKARGENFKAVAALQKAHPDYLLYSGNETSREVFEIFFPIIEWETIKEEAKRHGLDPFVVAGLIRQESVFDPRAHSRANAMGLMQLLPSTGKLVAKKNGSGNITSEQLYNPRLNIRLGTAYLADMINQYGRVEYAAAAYNGGPGRVNKWLKTLPSDLEEWVEAIPITETRLYVQGVLRNAGHYRRLYGTNLNN